MPSVSSRGKLILVILAALLSAFNGVLSVLSMMMFSGHESTQTWVSIYVPAVLWVAAAICYKFPRIGLFAYILLLLIALVLCVGLFSHAQTGVAQWLACAYNLRFVLVAGALLILNVTILKPSE